MAGSQACRGHFHLLTNFMLIFVADLKLNRRRRSMCRVTDRDQTEVYVFMAFARQCAQAG